MSKGSNVYVITGGAGGMGEAIARRVQKRGTLLLTDINAARLDQLAAQLRSDGLRIQTQVGDVTDIESVRSLARTARSMGRLAGLVHTAGLSPTMASWKRIFEVDLIGTALLLEGFLPLAETGTVAVCIASTAGHLVSPTPELAAVLSEPLKKDFFERMECLSQKDDPNDAYRMAKRGVILLCQHMAPAWGSRGARIVSVSPGIIDTAMSRQEFKSQPSMKTMVEMTPLKRLGKPEEIASAVGFLLSEDASYITGTDLLVDGGVVPQFLRAGRG